MSKKRVFHYTDYKSPYAYLAVQLAYDLEKDFDLEVVWRPYTLDIPSFLGSVEERSETQWRKVKYAYMDMRRFANKRNLTIKGPRKVYDSRPANIGMLYAQNHGPEVFRAYNDAVFYRFWNHILEIDDVDAIEAVLAEVGANSDGYRPFLQGEGLIIHDDLKAEADQQGIFGVPSFVHEGEIFWGCDRVDLLREKLEE
ncbi:MAG: disulfide bond formation protein DsbA [Alphaproteobacteria bacterium]|nr:disulfide bond formation protein DsbA [Alphaproteobacteria bacterium]MBT4017489.1 disulfide bond formation protein DsbA [Alphaproteobacteria bacterium]MBT4967029.1 disulfide bond formation protein DsbA [Alphaproteobacteria bacterium]MBT5161853.1 disulfide bond formation protein DsbA [Alphaproteobacteria bacterium]MBT5918302.1 disulfide bond formation protein DsbA [Alphaproteobacteria bacterium]